MIILIISSAGCFNFSSFLSSNMQQLKFKSKNELVKRNIAILITVDEVSVTSSAITRALEVTKSTSLSIIRASYFDRGI